MVDLWKSRLALVISLLFACHVSHVFFCKCHHHIGMTWLRKPILSARNLTAGKLICRTKNSDGKGSMATRDPSSITTYVKYVFLRRVEWGKKKLRFTRQGNSLEEKKGKKKNQQIFKTKTKTTPERWHDQKKTKSIIPSFICYLARYSLLALLRRSPLMTVDVRLRIWGGGWWWILTWMITNRQGRAGNWCQATCQDAYP